MNRSRIPSPGSLCRLGLVVLLGLCVLVGPAGQASAAAGTPHVTVFSKNYHAEYDLATAQFLEQQFEFSASPAYGLVTYTIVNALTTEALAGSTALVVDESADMALTDAEATIIRDFALGGGKVGLFAFPRHYWDGGAANPAAYQAVAELWGITAVGDPAAAEAESGKSSATVPEPEEGAPSLAGPYAITNKTVETFDYLPFSPVTATAASVLRSPALGQAPTAVANEHGIFVTNPIGDAVQGADANTTYGQFVVNAIVWLAGARPQGGSQLFLPLLLR